MSNSITQEITVLNQTVSCIDGLFSLNDLHKASGGKEKHKPANFLRLDTTKALIYEIEEENLNCSDMSNKKIALKSIAGRFGGSYGCKELIYAYAMWISAKFNLAVIRAFDRQQSNIFDPSKLSRSDILRLALDAEEENQKLTAKIEADKPLVEFSIRHEKAEGLFCLRDAAKQIGMTQNAFIKWLHMSGYIFRQGGKHWMPYADAQKRGFLDVKVGTVLLADGTDRATQQCMVTAKGIQHFDKRLKREGLVV